MNNIKITYETVKLTDDEFNILTEHAWILKMSRNDYVTGLTQDIKDKLFNIYKRLGFTINNYNCSSCVINALKTLSKIYDDELEKRNDLISVEDKKKVKKNGRKK